MTTSRVKLYPASSALSPASTSTSPLAAAGSGFASRETQVGLVVASAAETGVTLGQILARPVSPAPGSSAATHSFVFSLDRKSVV